MNKTINDILYFLTAVVLVKAIGMFTSIFLARFLSPTNYGVWAILALIVSYSPIVCLGTVETLVKQFPFYAGKGEHNKAREIEQGVFGSIILASVFMVLLGIILPFILKDDFVFTHKNLVRTMMFASAVSLFCAFFYHRFVAHQNFKAVSIIESSRAVILFILIVTLSYYFGITGTVFGYFGTEIILLTVSVFISIKSCGAIRPIFNITLLYRLVKIGLPISFIWWLFIIQTSIDRIISISMLGKEKTGYFSLGVSILSVIVLIPQVIGRVLYPRINEEVGKGEEKEKLANLIVLPTRIFSIVLPMAIGSMILLIPTVYFMFFPKYIPGIASAQILLFGVYFLTVIRNGINYLVSIDKQNTLLVYMLISISMNIILNIVFIKYGLGINGIAFSTSISQACLATLIWLHVFKCMGFLRIRQLFELVYLYLPFVLMVVIIFIIWCFMLKSLNEFQSIAYLHVIIYWMAYILIVLFVNPFKTWTRDIWEMRKKVGLNAGVKEIASEA